MELMNTLRVLLFFIGPSFSFWYDLGIVLERFCGVFNVRDVNMVRIDASTRKPIQSGDRN